MELVLDQPGRGERSRPVRAGHPLRPVPDSGPRDAQPDLEALWDRHGRALHSLACALLGDEAAADEAVTLAMADLVRSTEAVSAHNARRLIARHVYRRSQELAGRTPRTLQLPPVMVWLGQLAHLQRASLALCVFGGHTHREAAGLLGVPPVTVAELLTAGLRELSTFALGEAPHSA